MNAPVHNFTMEEVFPLTDSQRAHRAAISIHCPNEGEDKMASRVAIAEIRDRAAAGMRRCSGDTYGILSEVARLATTAVYAPASPRRLTLIRAGLRDLLDAARMIERAGRDG